MEHGWLTTLRPDGAPQTSRVWFVELDGLLWVATSESALKVRDIRRDSRVSFSIEGRDGGTTGTASVEDIDSAPEVLREFAAKYNGWNAADPGAYGPRVLIRIRRP
jgi:general stress protein 26